MFPLPETNPLKQKEVILLITKLNLRISEIEARHLEMEESVQ